jgi:hypothetical protein
MISGQGRGRKLKMKDLGFLHLLIKKNKQLNEKIEEELVMKGHKCRIFTKNIDEHG